jgi:hypothetical protein
MNSVQNPASDASYTTNLRRIKALAAFRASMRAKTTPQFPNQEAPLTGVTATDAIDTKLGACACACGAAQCS